AQVHNSLVLPPTLFSDSKKWAEVRHLPGGLSLFWSWGKRDQIAVKSDQRREGSQANFMLHLTPYQKNVLYPSSLAICQIGSRRMRCGVAISNVVNQKRSSPPAFSVISFK